MLRFLALGAGQDVGRSCVVVTLDGANVMFDCGMHMGYLDARRFPDFTVLGATDLTLAIDCVIISHFHLDHCGALPYLTEQCGYRGPVLMTHPTRALAPILLEDYRKITSERRGEAGFFTSQMLRASLARAHGLHVGQTHVVEAVRKHARLQIEVTPHYAGHVLGAAMFHVRVGRRSVMYTGDYNMTADRHLGPARAALALRPDVLITESTYATTLRDSKRRREAEFLRAVDECVSAGGKVLVPVFALGRVQELCVLLEAHWTQSPRLQHVPIYYSAGMAETANAYYRVFLDWASDRLQAECPVRNLLDFCHVKAFQKHYAEMPGPMVLFSSPGMLHSGTSLEVFRRWAGDARNLLIIPGFCVSGTVGARLLAGQRRIVLEESERGDGGGSGPEVLQVRMTVQSMSFSAHADARGILQMIRTTQPATVVLVHGEAPKMAQLRGRIQTELGLPCFDPPNGALIDIPVGTTGVPILVSGAGSDGSGTEGRSLAALVAPWRHALQATADELLSFDAAPGAVAELAVQRAAGPAGGLAGRQLDWAYGQDGVSLSLTVNADAPTEMHLFIETPEAPQWADWAQRTTDDWHASSATPGSNEAPHRVPDSFCIEAKGPGTVQMRFPLASISAVSSVLAHLASASAVDPTLTMTISE